MLKKCTKLFALLLSIALIASLVACSTPDQTGSDPASVQQSEDSTSPAPVENSGEPVTLTMFTYNGSTEETLDFYRNLIAQFQNDNPGVTIDLVLTEDPTGLSTQQLAAGGGPDILTVEPTSVQLFADANYIIPLNQYADTYGWNGLFDDWAANTTSKDGQLMGLPGAIDGLLVFYNKTMFEENGWQIPKNNQEFIALCDAVKASGKIPFAFGSSDFKMANQWWLSMAYSAALGQEKFHSVLQGGMRWDSDDVRGATQKLVDMWANGNIYENSAGITLDDMVNLFIGGQSAMMMSGQWDVETILDLDPAFEWSVFKMPAWNEGFEAPLPVAIGETFSINSKCKNPDIAAKFLNELVSDETIMKRLALGVLYPTSNTDPSTLTDIDPHYIEAYNIMLDAMETNNIGYCAWTYWPPVVDTYAWNNLESLYLGQITLDEYLKNLQSSYEEDVERNSVLTF